MRRAYYDHLSSLGDSEELQREVEAHITQYGKGPIWQHFAEHHPALVRPDAPFKINKSRAAATRPAYVGVTDFDWFTSLASQPGLEEVNFWRPGLQRFRGLAPGQPFIFKLRAPRNMIAGFGHFRRYDRLPLWLAWDVFGTANGAASEVELRERLAKLGKDKALLTDPERQIGCITLSDCVFLPPDEWLTPPSDWSSNIVSGKGYDIGVSEGRRVWDSLLAAAGDLGVAREEAAGTARYGAPQTVLPRLGQQSFRLAVRDAYGACAVTGEHSLPVLDAAHIQPYAQGGKHQLINGMLLRRDVHRLFDLGYVTVTPEYRFAVSDELRAQYDNGRVYYKMAGTKLGLPLDQSEQPDKESLAWHGENVFRG